MKLKGKGTVPFSLRQRDIDLRNLIEQLPQHDGSEILREILRDGIAYQRLVRKGELPPTKLSILMSYMDLDFIVEDNKYPQKKISNIVQVEDQPQQEEIVEEIQVKPEPEEIEDFGDFNVSDDEFL